MTGFFEIKENRVVWVDVARGVGLLLVIIGHLRLPYAAAWVYTFHMPLFFFLSGCVYRQPDSFKAFLKKKIPRLFIPYWFLGLVIWLFYATMSLFSDYGVKMYGSNLDMLGNLILQKGFWTIWFLACLFLCQIIFYFVLKVGGNRATPSFAVSIVLSCVAYLYYRTGGRILPWDVDAALVAQFYFCCGYFFVKSKMFGKLLVSQNKRATFLKCLFFLGLNVFAGYLCVRLSGRSLNMSIGMYGNELATTVSALSGIAFVVMVSAGAAFKPLIYLGQNAMIIFAWHSRIVLVALYYLYERLGLFADNSLSAQFLKGIASFSLILIILVPATELIKKTKFKRLFGV